MRLEQHKDFSLFKEVHKSLEPATICRVAKIRPDSLSLIKFLSRLCCNKPSEQPVLCSKYTHQYMHIEVVHALLSAPLPTRDTSTNVPRNRSATKRTAARTLKKRRTCNTGVVPHIDDVISDLMPIELFPEFLINCANFLQSVLAV
ncbi:hypothetical protein DPMN_030675 [Dreissena polymorpha]|uniref:Uncharacterized protein n=1 Tax=Dreissena polymorpha TaxID=45954 RepID=A0A9D4M181_DREPO|nr:hypothetical protein DPMN_030675 [Dreissena polymorpha]